jgi:hypothetical protein
MTWVTWCVQALQDNQPEQWASLPDLPAKRGDYYAALEASNRSMIGAQQVRPWTLQGHTVCLLHTAHMPLGTHRPGWLTVRCSFLNQHVNECGCVTGLGCSCID